MRFERVSLLMLKFYRFKVRILIHVLNGCIYIFRNSDVNYDYAKDTVLERNEQDDFSIR